MNNLSSYCGLVDAKIRASDKDLPVFAEVSSTEIELLISSVAVMSLRRTRGPFQGRRKALLLGDPY